MSSFGIMFLTCYGVTAVCTLANLVNVASLMDAPKRRRPEKLERLRSPHIIINNTPRTTLNILTFLKDLQYEALGDGTIIAAGRSLIDSSGLPVGGACVAK